MIDLSKEFNLFYRNWVVLPQGEKNKLYEKSRLNINRLIQGLNDYNEENNTNYQLKDQVVQGSVAMSTITQKDQKDYDIDVAIIFDKKDIPEGTRATKNFVKNALERKCQGLKNNPELKTNCIRIIYKEGYQIDFAPYRRGRIGADFEYDHCGSVWRERDPRAINKWFFEQNRGKEDGLRKNDDLRKVVRLLKMFTKSRLGWTNMPGGLILSVLADEQLNSNKRLDETFYFSTKAIYNRLLRNKEIYDPTAPGKSLKLVQKDDVRIDNFLTRLEKNLGYLEILFSPGCSRKEALDAWGKFFSHFFWEEQKDQITEQYSRMDEIWDYDDTEEFIEYLFPIDLQFNINLDCKVIENEKFIGWLKDFFKKRKLLLPGKKLHFYADTTTPQPYNIYWKVKNCGEEARRRNCLRGQIKKEESLYLYEETSFKGPHYVECYIIKNGVCVARGKINVPIMVPSRY